jgi:hypothetical protein
MRAKGECPDLVARLIGTWAEAEKSRGPACPLSDFAKFFKVRRRPGYPSNFSEPAKNSRPMSIPVRITVFGGGLLIGLLEKLPQRKRLKTILQTLPQRRAKKNYLQRILKKTATLWTLFRPARITDITDASL